MEKLIDNILSETICRFYLCILFSNIYLKINVMAKNVSDLCSFYSKQDLFLLYFYSIIFLLFLLILNLLIYPDNIVKISEIIKKWKSKAQLFKASLA